MLRPRADLVSLIEDGLRRRVSRRQQFPLAEKKISVSSPSIER